MIIFILAFFLILYSEGRSDSAKDNNAHLSIPTTNYGVSGFFSQLLVNDNGTLIAKNPARAAERRTKTNADTAGAQNRITKFWGENSHDMFHLKMELKDKDQKINIKVFNILGNQVLDVYNGYPLSDDEEYDINTERLPNGVYICKIFGKNFHLSRKFVISR